MGRSTVKDARSTTEDGQASALDSSMKSDRSPSLRRFHITGQRPDQTARQTYVRPPFVRPLGIGGGGRDEVLGLYHIPLLLSVPDVALSILFHFAFEQSHIFSGSLHRSSENHSLDSINLACFLDDFVWASSLRRRRTHHVVATDSHLHDEKRPTFER